MFEVKIEYFGTSPVLTIYFNNVVIFRKNVESDVKQLQIPDGVDFITDVVCKAYELGFTDGALAETNK